MSKIVTREQAAAELLLRQSAEDSLFQFTKQAWNIAEGARTFQPGWYLEAFAEHLEALIAGQIRNLLANVPPRMYKSGLGSVMLPPWAWIKQSHLQFLYVSYAQTLSERDSRKGRQIIESNWYRTRWGDKYRIVSDSNTKLRFDNDQGGYRLSSSVDAKVTGEGGDILVCLPYEAMVLLADGSQMEIGAIVDGRRDVWVLSFNHAERRCEPALIEAFEENTGRELLEIDIGDRILRCTEDHPVWTENRGYVAAHLLLPGDRVIVSEGLS